MATATADLKVKTGPRAANDRFAFRVTSDFKLVFTKSPVKVPSHHECIDLHSMVRRYVAAGYLEIV